MKRPLLVVVVGYIIGIVWGLYCNCSIALLYAIITVFYILLKLFSKPHKKLKLFSFKRYFRYIKIYLTFSVISGIIIFSLISNIIIQNQNKKYNNLYKNINEVNLTGVIVSNCKEKEYVNVYKIKVETLNDNTKFRNTYLLVNMKKNMHIKYGDRVEIKGKFIEPNVQRNYKGFDYKEFLKTQKIYGTIQVSKAKVIDENCNNFLMTYSNKVFLSIKQNIEKAFSKDMGNLMLGIMVGDTDNIDEDIMQTFRDSDMAHVLAVSGMHITYVILGTITMLKPMLRKKKKQNNCNFYIDCIYVHYRFYSICCACYYNGCNNVRKRNIT